MKRRLTKKEMDRRTKLVNLTNVCWVKATLGREVKPEERRDYTDRYLYWVRKLPTQQLKMILKGHEDGLVRRAPETLLAVRNEIFERSLK